MAFWIDKQTGKVVGQYRSARCERHHYDKKSKNKAMYKDEILKVIDAFLTLLSKASAYTELTDEQRKTIKQLRLFCQEQQTAIQTCEDENALYVIDLLHATEDMNSAVIPYDTPVAKTEDVLDRNYTVYRLYTYPTETWATTCKNYVWSAVCTERCSRTAYRPVLLPFEPSLVTNKAKIDALVERNNQLTTYSCISCGYFFVIPDSEQAFFAAHGFKLPKHCRKCRARRQKENNEKA